MPKGRLNGARFRIVEYKADPQRKCNWICTLECGHVQYVAGSTHPQIPRPVCLPCFRRIEKEKKVKAYGESRGRAWKHDWVTYAGRTYCRECKKVKIRTDVDGQCLGRKSRQRKTVALARELSRNASVGPSATPTTTE